MRPLPYLAAFLLALPAAAQTAPPVATSQPAKADPAFTERANQLPGALTGKVAYDGYFAPSFKAAVPREKWAMVAAQFAAAGVTGIERIEQKTPWSATVHVGLGEAVATMNLAVDPAPPHQVTGLLVTGSQLRDGGKTPATPQGALDAIKALRGSAGFAISKLGAGAPQLIQGYNADKPYAIGSAFKLVILAELVRETNAGARKWDDLVTLDGSALPGGGYTMKPRGTQVSLRELATQMISISDNSATDILLKTLGREKVEAMMPVLGIADPARNRPFLSTLEMFKLKGVAGLAERYLARDEAGRRKLLDGEIAGVPNILINATSFNTKTPKLIDTFEWFESPNDLVRVLDWLRRNTEGPAGADARAVLSKNPGLGADAKARWQWVGYKGGSEPGVMNMSYLLQAKGGDWYVVTASWNDPAKEVEQGHFAALIARAAELVP
ncbi:serine hydrolase [Sphingomonas sp. HITSZ_GF]|uniref:serine hydrolase n=1 Tax=Sphingomonas sp. HITSZ_GF TaxID=3037247 RepID=UPI00240D6B9D|nr:serine hydrolase [Sphingomonas sp. HITSZ_GF]MDG2535432.1 serine hydrolase [Sphingomonas sp. HITSZ_GF]